MNGTSLAIQRLGLILFFNAALLATIVVIGGDAVQAQWPEVVGTGLVFSLALWFVLQRLSPNQPAAPSPDEDQEAPPAEPATDLTPAVQMLSILQRKGRLIDFLQEDIQQFDDAQIGAAVRTVHDGCRNALAEHVDLAPIVDDAEGVTITVEPGFDAHEIRLTGNVSGDPPFKGALRHRGWRVKKLDLPEQMQTDKGAMVVASAEVEIK